VHVVASSHTVTVFARPVLNDVATGISRFTIIDDVFRDRGRPVSLGVLGMNRGLSLSCQEGSAGCCEAGPRRLEAELSACCMAAVSRSPQISSRACRASRFDGSGMLRRSMAAVTTFWLARPKTGGLTARSSAMRRLTSRALSRAPPPCACAARSCSRVHCSRRRFSRSSSTRSCNSQICSSCIP
jgi:hypothetical protein